MVLYTYIIQEIVRIFAGVPKRWNFAERFPELMLSHVKVGRLLANVRHLCGLKWRHLLLDCDSNLLRIAPLLWQSLSKVQEKYM